MPNVKSRTPLGSSILACGLVVAAAVGCGGKKKDIAPIELLSGEWAYRKGMEQLSEHQLREAIETLQRIQYTPESIEEIEPLARMAIADATYYKDTDLAWIDARSLYLDYVTLYGDHPLAAYAQTQAGMCSLRQVSHPSRDQSQTHQAIADLEEVGRRYPDSPFTDVARGLLRKVRSNLAESEYLVGRFYLKRKHYIAAAERFDNILENYPDFTGTEAVLYELAKTLLSMNSVVKARLYLEQLLADYPQGKYAGPSRERLAQLAEEPARGSARSEQ